MDKEFEVKVDKQKFYSWIIEAYSDMAQMTARECSEYLYKAGKIPLPIRQATAPRITELVDREVLEVVGKKIDIQSKKRVSIYSLLVTE